MRRTALILAVAVLVLIAVACHRPPAPQPCSIEPAACVDPLGTGADPHETDCTHEYPNDCVPVVSQPRRDRPVSGFYEDREGAMWDVVGEIKESADRMIVVLRRVPDDRAAVVRAERAKRDALAASEAVSTRWQEILADPDHPPSLAAVIALNAAAKDPEGEQGEGWADPPAPSQRRPAPLTEVDSD